MQGMAQMSSAQQDGYPQLYEYFGGGDGDGVQPVYWEQYYSDIDYNDEETDKYPRQLQETLPQSRDKRRQVFTFLSLSAPYRASGLVRVNLLHADHVKPLVRKIRGPMPEKLLKNLLKFTPSK